MKNNNNSNTRRAYNDFRKAVTRVATKAQDWMDKGFSVTPMQEAFAKALDRKLQQDPSFGWRS